MSWTQDLLASLKRLIGTRPRPVEETAVAIPGPEPTAPEPAFEVPQDESGSVAAAAPAEPEVAAVAPQPEAPLPGTSLPATPAPASAAAPSAEPRSLTLRLESERGPVSLFEVTRSGATIGRAPESTIRLDDLSVSRRHARIAWKQGAYWLSDVGSMGGTWVDGSKLNAPRRIAEGQRIDIGVCTLTVAAAPQLPVSSGSSSHSGNGSGSRRSGGA